jgi:hypothetical protein
LLYQSHLPGSFPFLELLFLGNGRLSVSPGGRPFLDSRLRGNDASVLLAVPGNYSGAHLPEEPKKSPRAFHPSAPPEVSKAARLGLLLPGKTALTNIYRVET